jgi:UDP-N-acetylmuramate--alanine ligase
MNLNNIKTVYFVGIGGIGMSAIARYFLSLGVSVHGYDRTETELTKNLAAEGMLIHYTDDVSFIPEGVDLVVWTPAIPKDHKELNYFKNNNFPLKKRAEVLGIISQSKKTIAVGGTHGKTTTSSLVTHLLRTADLDCTAFLGGIAENYKSNYIEGKSEWVVVEADEYDRSFLHLHPTVTIITSMDADHLDIYGTEEEIKKSFTQFASQTNWDRDSSIIARDGLPLTVSDRYVSTYGVDCGATQAKNVRAENGYMVFDFDTQLIKMKDLKYTQPGLYNVENALAAISAAIRTGYMGEYSVRQGLLTFKGIKRRFEIMHRSDNAIYIDDYAHHPTELEASIAAARLFFPDKKITGIFQPHLYSRTRDFVEGFARALDKLDAVILMDIYPARELQSDYEGVSADLIFDLMQNPNKIRVSKATLMDTLKNYDLEVLMTLGAGDIDTFREPIRKMVGGE